MSGPVNPGNRDESDNAARPTVRPFAALSRTVARSPVVLKILPFRIWPGRDGVVLIKESSIELYSLGLSLNSPNLGTTPMEYQFDLMHRTPTFGKIVSSTIIPYTVLPSSASLVEPSGTLNVSTPDEPRPPVQHDLSQYSTSPMNIDHPISSSQQRSQSIPKSAAREPSPRLGSDTLVLVTQDRHALFVTCGDQGEFMIDKIIELRDIIGTLTYDRGLHDDVSNIERKRYREQDTDESYVQSSDDDDYSISDISSISDTDSTVEDIASRIKSLGKDIQADRL
ncbi:hypothetical protein V1517DRAFT_259644 [Lipomyces orientalis]|uniref:Uncharacterized protein n=1 Tax=Lipomyces orientalis TaxID=1233043 RepID=A0ACC3TPA5_9ASCO